MYAEILLSRKLGPNINTLTYKVPDALVAKLQRGNIVSIGLRNKETRGVVSNLHEHQPAYETKEILEVVQKAAHLSPWQIDLMTWISDYYFCPLYKVLKLFFPNAISQKKKLPQWQPHQEETPWENQKLALTTEQQDAIETILKTSKSVILLHGITGSGKTEIYRRLAENQIQKNRQILILVPEISLTPQTFQNFREEFGSTIAILHSHLTAKAKEKHWYNIYHGEAKIIIGSRSALFAPFANLGMIVMDEEHEFSYKQDQSPRYHARDVAIKMAELLGIKCVLGSATPALETYYNATQGHYELVTMKQRIQKEHLKNRIQITSEQDGETPVPNITQAPTNGNNSEQSSREGEAPIRLCRLEGATQAPTTVTLPTVTIIDLREEIRKKNFSIFSELLIQKITEKLEKQEQIILFLNRRGAACAVLCRECGHIEKCDNCDVAMTYHKKINDQIMTSSRTEQAATVGTAIVGTEQCSVPTIVATAVTAIKTEKLICHHCGSIKNVPTLCPKCESVFIRYIGLGTQRIEEEIKKIFPKARILRADKDTTRQRDSFEKLYHAFKNHGADILIGTQMIGKGLHLPQVSLVGVILADLSLTIPDFRSAERTFQILTQVAGRAGREAKKGEVIIQTYLPENYAIRRAIEHDYEGFFEEEMKVRKTFTYPPASKLIKLTFIDKDTKKCLEKAKNMLDILTGTVQKNELKNAVISITNYPALIPKLKNEYRWHILITGQNPALLLKNVPANGTKILQDQGVRIDIDPISVV